MAENLWNFAEWIVCCKSMFVGEKMWSWRKKSFCLKMRPSQIWVSMNWWNFVLIGTQVCVAGLCSKEAVGICFKFLPWLWQQPGLWLVLWYWACARLEDTYFKQKCGAKASDRGVQIAPAKIQCHSSWGPWQGPDSDSPLLTPPVKDQQLFGNVLFKV